jgi:hypothetical protein
MSAQLDWEIEDVETPLPHTVPESKRQLHGCRRWLRVLALIALVAAVGLVFLRFRVVQERNKIEDELRVAVELELAALEGGDRDLFLNQQDTEDRTWRRVQETAFNNHHAQAGRAPWEDAPQVPRYTGKVPVVYVQGDEAWAEVEVERGDLTWRELWFYRWTQGAGWRHTRFDEDWLGEEQALATIHLRLAFPQRDEAIVSTLAREMEAWYDVVAPLVGVHPTSAIVLDVQFDHRGSRTPAPQPFWVADSFTLKAPSPHQGPLSDHGDPSSILRRQMAGYLAAAIIAHQAGLYPTQELAPAVNALRDELRDWAVARIAGIASEDAEWDTLPTPLIDALVARDGIGSLPRLIASLNQAETVQGTLATAGLNPPDPEVLLAFHVAAVTRAFHQLDKSSLNSLLDPQADGAWRRNQSSLLDWRQQAAQSGHIWPAVSALRLDSIAFTDPIAWVETETTRSDGSVYRQTYFFRYSDERWLLTSPDPAYFGERRTTRTENLVFNYFEREAQWFEERIPKLQSVFSQAAADLGIPTTGLVITVETEIEPGRDATLRFTSPAIAGWRVDRPDDQLPQMAIQLLGSLLQTRLQIGVEDNIHYFLAHVGAFVWELERLFPGQIDWEMWIGSSFDDVPPSRLADLWTVPADEPDQWEVERTMSGYRALFLFVTDAYGPKVVPALLDNALETDDPDEWLRSSIGDGLDEIEPLWQAWVLENYGEK